MKLLFQKLISVLFSILVSFGAVVIPEDTALIDDTGVSVSASEDDRIIVQDGVTEHEEGYFTFTVSSDGAATVTDVNFSRFNILNGAEVLSVPVRLCGFTVTRVDLKKDSYFVVPCVYLSQNIEYFASKNVFFEKLFCFSNDAQFNINMTDSFDVSCFEGSTADFLAKSSGLKTEYFSNFDKDLDLVYYVENSEAYIQYIAPQIDPDVVIPDKIDGFPVAGIHCDTLASRKYSDISSIWLPDDCEILDLGLEDSENPYSVPDIKCNLNSMPHGECFTYNLSCIYTLPDGTTKTQYGQSYGSISDNENNLSYLYVGVTDGEGWVAGWRPYYYAFQRFYANRKHVNIPDTIRGCPVTFVGGFFCSDFFEDEFESITFPETVTRLGSFSYSSKLRYINFDNIKIIDSRAFFECSSLQKPVFGKNLKEIGDYAFANIWYTSDLSFPKDCALEIIGDGAFSGSFFSSITLPNKVKMIGSEAFYDSCVDKLVLPASVEEVGNKLCDAEDGIVVLNKNMIFPDSDDVITEHNNIYGYAGSTAEAYAKKYGYNFVEIHETEVIFDNDIIKGNYLPIKLQNMSLKKFLAMISVGENSRIEMKDEDVREGTLIDIINESGYVEKTLTVVRLGDINEDDEVTTEDLTMLKDAVVGKSELIDGNRSFSSADFNLDGMINSTDIVLIKSYISGG